MLRGNQTVRMLQEVTNVGRVREDVTSIQGSCYTRKLLPWNLSFSLHHLHWIARCGIST